MKDLKINYLAVLVAIVLQFVLGFLWYGFLIGFVFVLLANMTSGMFAKDPYGLAWITGGFTTVGLAIGGAVLGAWTKSRSKS